jgi:NitT/TauT family transport system permease protein
MKRAARYIIFYAALLGLWTVLAELKIWPPYLFPTPWGVGQALYAGFQDHSYWIAIRVSMQRVLIGYGISVVLGMILGLGVASNKFLEETMGGLLVSLQSLPSICWWPLALLWFGLNQNAILFVVIMGSLLSVTLAMEDGRKQMPKIFGQAGRNLGAKGFKLFWYVLLPASLPFYRRDALSKSRTRPGPHDGPRSERHELRHRRHGLDHRHRLCRRRHCLQRDGTSSAK